MANAPDQIQLLRSVRRCIQLLDKTERRRWAGLIPLTLLAAGMEIVGAALIFTLISVISDPAQTSQMRFTRFLLERMAGGDTQTFVLYYCASVAVFYMVKNAALLLQIYASAKYANLSVVSLSSKLLRGYLRAPYSFHFRRNSADLIRNVRHSIDAAFRGMLFSVVNAAVEFVMVVSVLLVLLSTAPGVTLIAGLFMGGLLMLLLRMTHRTFARWGKQTHKLEGALMASLQQSLAGVKEVKVLGRERYFYETFAALRAEVSRIAWRRSTLDASPRLLIETIFVAGVVALIIFFQLKGTTKNLIAVLGLFAYAGFRILPSLHRMLGNINVIRFCSASVEEIYDDYEALVRPEEEREPAPSDLSFERSIEMRELSYRYNEEHQALLSINLRIARGESIGIVGPTGAGKTTLVDLLLGLLKPQEGEVLIDDHPLHQAPEDLSAWQRRLGYVPQALYLIDDTLRRNIALGLKEEEIDDAQVQRSVRMAQLETLVEKLPEGLHTVIGEKGVRLSGGERQRIAIARALYAQPDVLVFDEATSALDNETEAELTRAIEGLKGQKTLLVIAHRLSTVQRCDRIVFMHEGRVDGIGTFEALLQENPRFQKMATASQGSNAPDGFGATQI